MDSLVHFRTMIDYRDDADIVGEHYKRKKYFLFY